MTDSFKRVWKLDLKCCQFHLASLNMLNNFLKLIGWKIKIKSGWCLLAKEQEISWNQHEYGWTLREPCIGAASMLFKHPLLGPRFQKEFFSRLKLFCIFYFSSVSLPSYLIQTPVTRTHSSVSSHERTQTHLEEDRIQLHDLIANLRQRDRQRDKDTKRVDADRQADTGKWDSISSFLTFTAEFKKNLKRFLPSLKTILLSLFLLQHLIKTSGTKTHIKHTSYSYTYITQTHLPLWPLTTSDKQRLVWDTLLSSTDTHTHTHTMAAGECELSGINEQEDEL